MENNETVVTPEQEVEVHPTLSMIDNIILGDNVKAKTDFNLLMQQKTGERIDDFKTEIANDLIGMPKQTEPVDTETQEPAVQEESFDVMMALQNATPQRTADLELYSGAVIPIDETTANILVQYIATLGPDERQYFIEDMQQNERGLFKAIEIATHELGEQ